MREHKGNSIISFPSTYVVIDTETTGLDCEYCDLIEVSAVKVTDDKELEQFSSLIKPDDFEGLPSFITELTGITDEMLLSAPSIKEVVPQFMDFIGSDILIGHNVNFDINFLYDAAEKCGYALSNDFVDTMRIARKQYPEMAHHRLRDLVKKFGITVNRCHRALDDVLATKACYNHMKADIIAGQGITEFCKRTVKQSYNDYIAGLVSPDNIDISNPIYNKSVVFTGTLSCMSRKEALALVSSMGGIPTNSVTSKTNYLVVGNEEFVASVKNGESNKIKKARELHAKGKDVTILSENTFFNMLSES